MTTIEDLKRHLNYREATDEDRCDICAYSRRRLLSTRCDLIQTTVNPNAVCDLITIRTPTIEDSRKRIEGDITGQSEEFKKQRSRKGPMK